MSSEYDAEYGIGYQVGVTEEREEKIDDVLAYWLDRNTNEEVEAILTGDGRIGEDFTFLVIKDPFKQGLDLSEQKKVLDSEIKRLELTVLSEFGLFGGINIS